ncbi:MAG: glycosyl hydrolase [Polyangiaceae bacterium]|nr:glycosyl hydrolase [Polyangiaceae bacterium]
MPRPPLLFLALSALVAAAAAAPTGCADDELGSGGAQTTGTQTTSTQTGPGGAGGAGGGAGGAGGIPGDLLCPTTFTFTAPVGASNVRIPGEWNGFDLAAAPQMSGPTGAGVYTATVDLPPGLQAYKLTYDLAGNTEWVLDPSQGRRKYVGGVENSAVKVPDCRLPTFDVGSSQVTRPAPGQGSYQASLAFRDGIEGTGPDPAGFQATLERDGTSQPLGAPEFSVDGSGDVTLSLSGLPDGKYRVVVRGRTQGGRTGAPLRLVFWVEAERFDWKDALIYMVVTDRFRDGDPALNPGPTPDADPRGDWMGGDLEGLRAAIADGTLDALGVRAIWLTPFQTNPAGAYLASAGVHKVTGYHGYWPVKAREVDPRLGGEAALRALVTTAHQHGIRVLQDFVLNHVHEDHEYVAAHPEWFRTGCVCGTNNCDWTAHALDCMFAGYLPDINHSVPEANAAFVSDAMYWLDEFDLDGLRVDAVKHVEEVSTRNLAAEVREGFEAAGTRYFLMGETAMGWNDCADPCNDENYGTIAKYIGPFGLDGQFDFVLYHGVSYRTFAYGHKGMLHAAYWVEHGLTKWPAGAIMTPYIGSHDTARFATLSDYRGQDAAHDIGIPGNQWSNTAAAPGDAEPYERARVAMAWLLGLPGAPLLYYGDEYGQWGGADPNNRKMWRPEGLLTADEAATLDFVRKLGAARQAIPAMRRGDYVPLAATEDTLVFGRKIAAGQAAVVALTRAASAQSIQAPVGAALGFAPGTALHDALGGPDVVVPAGGTVTLTVPAKGALVLAP